MPGLLALLLPKRLRYADEGRSLALWVAEVGDALRALARGLARGGEA